MIGLLTLGATAFTWWKKEGENRETYNKFFDPKVWTEFLFALISLAENIITILLFDEDAFEDWEVFLAFTAFAVLDTLVKFFTAETPVKAAFIEVTSEAAQAYVYMIFCAWDKAAIISYTILAGVQIGLLVFKHQPIFESDHEKDQDGNSSGRDQKDAREDSTWEGLWKPLIMLSIGSVVTIVPVLCAEESDGMENTMHIENYHKRLFASGLDYVFIFLASDTFAWFQTSMLWFLENSGSPEYTLLGDDVEPWLIVNSAFACFIGLSVVPGYCWVMLDVTRQLCAGTLCDGDVCSEDTTLFWAVDCTQVGYHAGFEVTTDLGM